MPVEHGVGFSGWTAIKLQHLRAILRMHIRVTSSVLKRHAYYEQVCHFIDATAGPGRYEASGREVEGSPLVFLGIAEEEKLRPKEEV